MRDEHEAYVYARETDLIIGAALDVHKALGPGLLESAYESCLAHEFTLRDIPFGRQIEIPVVYKGERVECGFRLDFMAFDTVLIELKAADRLMPVHEAQLMTYMRLTQKRVGLLINFNVPILRDGIRRRVL